MGDAVSVDGLRLLRLIGDTPGFMRELSVAEQRYEAVRAVIAGGETVTDVAARFGVARKTVHGWLAKYEAGGLAGLADRSHRPRSCPHQMPAAVEVALVELRVGHPSWGPRRLRFELAKRGVVVSESAAYRALARLNLIDPTARRPRDRRWKRWERATAMELWQMDVVGGFVLADGTRAKALTGVDDHSRFCVSARLMSRESSRQVCDALARALRAYGCPEQILTDNGKVFTGRFTERSDGIWVARRASKVGVVCVNWQQVCLGAAAAGHDIDVWVTDQVMQFYDGDQLLRTPQREHRGEVRKKRASIPGGRPTLKASVTKHPK
jgi:transposase